APTSNATRPYSMFVLLLDAGRMLPGSPTPHMSRHTLVTRAQGPVTLSVLANGAGSRSTDEVRPEPASGSARLPRENPTTRPPGQAGITYKERLQPRWVSGRRGIPMPIAAEAAPTAAGMVRGRASAALRAGCGLVRECPGLPGRRPRPSAVRRPRAPRRAGACRAIPAAAG